MTMMHDVMKFAVVFFLKFYLNVVKKAKKKKSFFFLMLVVENK